MWLLWEFVSSIFLSEINSIITANSKQQTQPNLKQLIHPSGTQMIQKVECPKCLSDTVPVQVVVKLTTLYRQDNILFTYVPQGLIERPAMYMTPSAIHHGEPGSAISPNAITVWTGMHI